MGAEYLCLTQEEHCVTRIDNYVGESVSQFCGEQRNPNPDVLVIIARAVEQARTMPRPARALKRRSTAQESLLPKENAL